MTTTLTILGASARAAIQSAVRAGLRPYCVDLFFDRDTQACANGEKVDTYPQDFEVAAKEAPPGPWLYTGGLENHPQVVQLISERKELWGNSDRVLRELLRPDRWSQTLLDASLPALKLCLAGETPQKGVRWLRKPIRSCGGQNIALADDPANLSPTAGSFLQEFVEGKAVSALVLSNGTKACLIGVTEQLIGPEWAGASGFCYAGSVGPYLASLTVENDVRQIADCLTRQFHLCGLWGIDGIVNSDGFWPVEINPRYTASVEILEWASGQPLLTLHHLACVNSQLPSPDLFQPLRSQSPKRSLRGKAIGFAKTNFTVSPQLHEEAAALNSERAWPIVSDNPHVGEVIPSGRPVLTVFAEGGSTSEVIARLRQRLAGLIYQG